MKIFLVEFLRRKFNEEFIEIKLNKPMDLIEILNKRALQLSEAVLINFKNLSPPSIFLINGVSIDIIGEPKKILKDEDNLTIIPVSHGG